MFLGEKTKQLNTEQAERDVKLKTAGANLTQQYFTREYGLQDGDVADALQAQPVKQFRALPNQAYSFAADVRKLSQDQQEVEELTDVQGPLNLLNQNQIAYLIKQSESPEELALNLQNLIPNASKTEYTANLERALYSGDVLGYVLASSSG